MVLSNIRRSHVPWPDAVTLKQKKGPKDVAKQQQKKSITTIALHLQRSTHQRYYYLNAALIIIIKGSNVASVQWLRETSTSTVCSFHYNKC